MIDILEYEIVDSTQFVAERLIDQKNAKDRIIILAKEQTNGITTKENILWHSPRGNLYASIILINHDKIDLIFSYLGISIQEFLKKEYNLDAQIKKPNDILISGKKICGSICQIYKNFAIIGFSINLVSHPIITHNLSATSINFELKQQKKFNIKDILSEILFLFFYRVDGF